MVCTATEWVRASDHACHVHSSAGMKNSSVQAIVEDEKESRVRDSIYWHYLMSHSVDRARCDIKQAK